MINAIWQALRMAFLMGWEIFWPLVLGFGLSAIVQGLVSRKHISQLLPDSSPKSVTIASLLGAASSSCSYAAVAITRSMIRKGADFISAMCFQIASTNLVFELAIVMIIILGWLFTFAELIGGIFLIIITALLFWIWVPKSLIEEAKTQAESGLTGKMEGHAHMDMSIPPGPFFQRLFSKKAFTVISHYFIMDWASLWKDIVIGLLIAGALAAWVPHDFWTAFFLNSHTTIAKIWGPIIGPVIAILSFVCSVGNIPLAAVLWNGGISFGGVIAFIYADLLIIPILNIYRKYYGMKMAAVIFGIYYVAGIITALIIEYGFQLLNILPTQRNVQVIEQSIQLNYTTILNICFGFLAVLLLYRFLKTGGPHMLKHMK